MDLDSYLDLVRKVKNLPYGRNSDRADYTLVLKERRGSCSTKHAYLKWIAEKEGVDGVELYLCVFKMNPSNTGAIAPILGKYDLDFIPEAHCFIRIKDEPCDVTFPKSEFQNLSDDILYQEKISPDQIGKYKIAFHKNYLRDWLKKEEIPFNFDQLWKIREECISALSH